MKTSCWHSLQLPGNNDHEVLSDSGYLELCGFANQNDVGFNKKQEAWRHTYVNI